MLRGVNINNRVLMIGETYSQYLSFLSMDFLGGLWRNDAGTVSKIADIYELDLVSENWTKIGLMKYSREAHALSVLSNDTWQYCQT